MCIYNDTGMTKAASNLKKLMLSNGIKNPTQLANLMGDKKYQVSAHRILSGETREPRESSLQPFADFFGVAALDFFKDGGDVKPVNQQHSITQLKIPILDVEASGGMGSLNGSELVNDHMTVEKSYLGEFGLPTDNLKIITIRGDSMEPELTSGDLVLVHHVPITVNKMHDGMFVVLIDDLLFIKRLQRLPGKKIKVISSNRDAYDPFTIDAVDLSIVGRVVFAWRGKKF